MYLVCREAAVERRSSEVNRGRPWACRLWLSRQWIALRAWCWLNFVAASLPNLWHALAWAVPFTGPANASAAAAMRAAEAGKSRYGIRSTIPLRDSALRAQLPSQEPRPPPERSDICPGACPRWKLGLRPAPAEDRGVG